MIDISPALEFITGLTKTLTPSMVQGLVDKNISFWWDCTTPEIRQNIRQSVRESLNGSIIMLSFVSDDVVVGLISNARPDLKSVLDTPKGQKWIRDLVRTLRLELMT